MATLRNKTTSEGIIIRWKPYPDHGHPSTYQVKDSAVSLLADLGYNVPNAGDEAEIPRDICRPLRTLDDLYFKSQSAENTEKEDMGNISEDFAESLNERQRRKLLKYISNHNSYNKKIEQLDEEISYLSPKNDSKKEIEPINQSKLQRGELLTAEISRVGSSGNGIIQMNSVFINVGPVKHDSEGDEIEIEIVTPTFAVCVTEEARGKNYLNKFWKIDRDAFYKYGHPKIESVRFCGDCGSVALKRQNIWNCGTCGAEFGEPESRNGDMHSDKDELDLPEPGEVIEEICTAVDSQGNICSENNKSVKINGNIVFGEKCDVKIETKRDGYVVASILTDDQRSSIEQLRKEAKKESKEKIADGESKSSSKTASYSRSQKVKDYVKARADGACEGCDEPAPFTSKTGEPYLQVHHIHELSDGGSDSPENVIALCPNCHYQVHHGEGGENYNDNLYDKVRQKEDKYS